MIAAFSVQYIQGYWKFVPIVITVSVLSFAAYHSHKKKQSKKKNRKKTYTTTTAAEADDEPNTTNELFLLKRIDYKTHITIISSFPK